MFQKLSHLKPQSQSKTVLLFVIVLVACVGILLLSCSDTISVSCNTKTTPSSLASSSSSSSSTQQQQDNPKILQLEKTISTLEQNLVNLQRQMRIHEFPTWKPVSFDSSSSSSSSSVQNKNQQQEHQTSVYIPSHHHHASSKQRADTPHEYTVNAQSRYISRQYTNIDSPIEITRVDVSRNVHDSIGEPFVYYGIDSPELAIDGDIDSAAQSDFCVPTSSGDTSNSGCWFEMDLALPMKFGDDTNVDAESSSSSSRLKCVKIFNRRDYHQVHFTDMKLVFLDSDRKVIYASPMMNKGKINDMVLEFEFSNNKNFFNENKKIATIRVEKAFSSTEKIKASLSIGEIQLFTSSSSCSVAAGKNEHPRPHALRLIKPAFAAPGKKLALFEQEQHRLVHLMTSRTYHCRDRRHVGGDGGWMMDGSWSLCFDMPLHIRNNNNNNDNDNEQQQGGGDCVVYSVGSLNDFTFDDAMASRYGCAVHTFDHTVGWPTEKVIRTVEQQQQPSSSSTSSSSSKKQTKPGIVNKYGLGLVGHRDSDTHPKLRTLPELMEIAKTPNITVLKTDIEGYEWGVLETILDVAAAGKINQVVFEIHFDEPASNAYYNVPKGEKPNHDVLHKMYKQISKFHKHFYLFGFHMNIFAGTYFGPRVMPRCHEVFFIRKDLVKHLIPSSSPQDSD